MSPTTTRRKSPPQSPVTVYAAAVVAGKILAGPWVRLACARHLRDLEHGGERGLYWDEAAAQRVFAFFGHLRLFEGLHAGEPFELQPWQQFIIGELFGWKQADGMRRFRRSYVETAKGNGKTPMAAGICLYGLLADGEQGAEIYSAAVTRDQAGIMFGDAKKMVNASPALQRRVEVNVHNLSVLATNSFFRPISSEAKSLDGKRVHMGGVDELHEHPSAVVLDKLSLSTKGRAQPMINEWTNAGYNRNSVCWQHHEYSLKVVQGVIEDDEWFAYVCALDHPTATSLADSVPEGDARDVPQSGEQYAPGEPSGGDDWHDEAVWIKTNPNLDVSVTRQFLRQQVREAEGLPAKQSIVLRFCFCEWVEQANPWFDLALWDQGQEAVSADALEGRACFVGMDLSSNTDLTAVALLFPPVEEEERWQVLMRFWIPEDNVQERIRRDRVPYDAWLRAGWIKSTPGNVVDKDYIEAEILELGTRYKIVELAYDRMFADQMVQHLMSEGLTVVPFGQGFYSMAAPCKELERLVFGRLLQHGGHPILRWNASNVVASQDPAGNRKPDKEKSRERIDGIVAVLMALGRAIVTADAPGSVYDERGFLVI